MEMAVSAMVVPLCPSHARYDSVCLDLACYPLALYCHFLPYLTIAPIALSVLSL